MLSRIIENLGDVRAERARGVRAEKPCRYFL
jgi:hypothetical protein